MTAHEFDLINWIRERTGVLSDGNIGIGDDTAVWTVGETQILLASDLLMEGTHFTFPAATPELAGRKALAVNLSDIAAMGGTPQTALVSLVLPRERGMDFAKRVMSGMIDLADEFGVSIVGGDTNSWDGPLVINVTITGEAGAQGPILRSGAHPGDAIFVTGPLGGSLAGHHLTFTPKVREAQLLCELLDLHAMIDLSDGLASDLRHILTASNVGCVLKETEIPISEAVQSAHPKEKWLEHALGDGEDFELIFTASQDTAKLLQNQPELTVFQIGTITTEANAALIELSDGSTVTLSESGWKHKFG